MTPTVRVILGSLLLVGAWGVLAVFLRGARTRIIEDRETPPDGVSDGWVRNQRRSDVDS